MKHEELLPQRTDTAVLSLMSLMYLTQSVLLHLT